MNRALFHAVLFPLALIHASAAFASEEMAPATAQEEVVESRDDLPAVSGNLFYFNRHRERYDVDAGRFRDNLRHQTLQANVDISSPFYVNAIGFELGLFSTADLANSASPDHEMSFFPWRNPWSPDWSKRDARSGSSLYRAHVKLRHVIDERQLWGKIGYFQPSGPGVLGVNWSLMPGTYRGFEGGMDNGPLAVAFAWADQYKAPWFPSLYHFRKNDRETRVDYLWSIGARYRFSSGLSAEAAYGESRDFLQSAHLKFKYTTPDEKLYLSYQLYGMADRGKANSPDNQYAGHYAHQHYLAAAYNARPYTLKAEFLHTRAPGRQPEHVGYFAYRLIGQYGGANGAYEPWWDNRSDWNHNKESAVFFSVSRSMHDILDFPGLTLGFSVAHGWGGKVYGTKETLRENAWSLDIAYTVPGGPLKNARASLHYTRYDNRTRLPSWSGFKNLFQDERDLKFLLTIPWQIR
ncbi:MAG: OprD family porin [Betaproteobacteria bacterium]|nr:OprD family porin [Betaproteobacteria bacterium]